MGAAGAVSTEALDDDHKEKDAAPQRPAEPRGGSAELPRSVGAAFWAEQGPSRIVPNGFGHPTPSEGLFRPSRHRRDMRNYRSRNGSWRLTTENEAGRKQAWTTPGVPPGRRLR
ncbi:hypothetical protein GCM10010519_62680 [Streptomyces lactacystinicus]